MLDMERFGELKRHRDEMMGHFGGYLNDFQEFEPVVRPPTMESNYPLLEIEEVVAAGDDEAGSSSFRGVSHPPEKPSIAEEPATSLSPFSTARVDVIACVSVNDAFVMEAWRKDLGIEDEVMLLSDGNGEFTGKLGVELDLRDKPVGLGVRSRRYAILAEDGVVKVLNLEEGGAFTNSGAEDMLKAL
ncbi:hypothetical protein YC2023_102132 [Brassica napus]